MHSMSSNTNKIQSSEKYIQYSHCLQVKVQWDELETSYYERQMKEIEIYNDKCADGVGEKIGVDLLRGS